jgi:hypothetical protein
MKKYLLCSLLLLLVSYKTNADICPSKEAIQNTPFNLVTPYQQSGSWSVLQASNMYDTSENWLFGFIAMQADNENDAMGKAYAALPYLSDPISSHPLDKPENWACVYTAILGAQQYLAVAINPPESLLSHVRIIN